MSKVLSLFTIAFIVAAIFAVTSISAQWHPPTPIDQCQYAFNFAGAYSTNATYNTGSYAVPACVEGTYTPKCLGILEAIKSSYDRAITALTQAQSACAATKTSACVASLASWSNDLSSTAIPAVQRAQVDCKTQVGAGTSCASDVNALVAVGSQATTDYNTAADNCFPSLLLAVSHDNKKLKEKKPNAKLN